MKVLRCPVCHNDLINHTKTYQCVNGHSFDVAKEGYCNLLISQSGKIHGDSKDMLQARKYIQDHDYYKEIADALVKMLQQIPSQTVLDIGCGIGYYTSVMNRHLKGRMIGIDISKDALKIAAKSSKETDYFVASNNALPIHTHSVDVVTSIFSPIYEEEVLRVVKPGGYVLVIEPNKNHLIELKEIIYEKIIEKREERNVLVDQAFRLLKEERVVKTVDFDASSLQNLLLMTPHFWTSSMEGKARLEKVKSLFLTIDVCLKLYQIYSPNH